MSGTWCAVSFHSGNTSG